MRVLVWRESSILLALVIAGCAGCSAWPLKTNAPPVTADVQQVAYLEDKYRDEGELAAEKPTGWAAYSPSNVMAGIKDAAGYGPDPKIARATFAEAEADYARALQAQGDERKSIFAQAAEKYAQAASRWPGSALEHDALFLAGEAYFFSDQYPAANQQFELLVKKHPNSRHMDVIDARRFAIAQYWLSLEKTAPQPFYLVNITDKSRPWYDTDGHAYRVFDRIRIDDPTGRLSDDATMAAANSHFLEGRYQKADDLYTDLRKAFPSSEHQFDAHFLGLKAKLLTYQGPDYSGQPLDDAEKLVKQIRRQFPQQAEEEREFLSRAYAEVRFRKAERLWSMGHYHEMRREYGAARYYYQHVSSEFEDTPFSKDAQDRIPTFADKPNTPPQVMPWLVNLFPPRESAKPLWKTDEAPVTGSTRKRR